MAIASTISSDWTTANGFGVVMGEAEPSCRKPSANALMKDGQASSKLKDNGTG